MLSRHASTAAVIALLTLMSTACQSEDARVASLQTGITKDSVHVVMGAPDVPPQAYLMGGQYIEILMFRSDGKSGPADGLQRKSLLPLVIVDGVGTPGFRCGTAQHSGRSRPVTGDVGSWHRWMAVVCCMCLVPALPQPRRMHPLLRGSAFLPVPASLVP